MQTEEENTGREKHDRTARFTGSYKESGSGGGFHRNSHLFEDPPSSLDILNSTLTSRNHEFISEARANFQRITMGDLVTKSMRERANNLSPAEQTPESQRMLDFPDEGLQRLGVERNHINANGQVATQLSAFMSTALNYTSKDDRATIFSGYDEYTRAHGLGTEQSKTLQKDFSTQLSIIENTNDYQTKRRATQDFLRTHTTAIADQSENLRFGKSQYAPHPDLNISLMEHPAVRSNQDVGSHFDGNRELNGSLTPRSGTIHKNIHDLEKRGIFPPGMAEASTTRPKLKETGMDFGSLSRIYNSKK
jgi:hypothetical protein